MAGDWIKMRSDLHTHPKVVRIMSALKADRLRVIGALHAVWCLFDAHSTDGKLDGYTPEALDLFIGWDGFARAMAAIGWLEIEAGSLATPRFDEHNGQSAKRRCQETQRKREGRNVSAPDADIVRSREDKSREEEKNTTPKKPRKAKAPQAEPVATTWPDWLPMDSWDAFVAMRVATKQPLTPTGIPLALHKLAELRAAGHDVRAVLEQSTLQNWRGLFEIRGNNAQRGGTDKFDPTAFVNRGRNNS